MSIVLGCILLVLLIYLAAATFYLLALASAYFILPEASVDVAPHLNDYAILVPAHNEELLVGNTCQSLQQVHYPADKHEIYVIADNCSDDTAAICREYGVHVLERADPQNSGKGQALAWGLKQIELDQFDAVLIVDADSYVDPGVLSELDKFIGDGEVAIQCYNAVGNRADSWFTQLLYVSRIINNQLYHEAKYRLGLSSFLMGNGICLNADLLHAKGWTAFSAGEDCEYYARLVEDNVKIAFAAKAKVFHQESRSLDQATSQRLRWSSGRFSIAGALGLRLFLKGIHEKKLWIVDASAPLLFPNYSLMINLTLVGFCFSLLLHGSNFKLLLLGGFSSLVIGQFTLFLAGVVIAGSPLQSFKAVLFTPFFLIWKAVIDLLCITGLYRGDKWVRTSRHKPSE